MFTVENLINTLKHYPKGLEVKIQNYGEPTSVDSIELKEYWLDGQKIVVIEHSSSGI